MTDYKTKYPIGSYWRTRGGDKVVVVGYEENDTTPIIVSFTTKAHSYTVCPTGKYYFEDGVHPSDLISPWVDKKRGEVWVLVCDSHYVVFRDGKEAVNNTHDAIARVKVTWEEGEFDE